MKNGYGRFRPNGQFYLAHRLAWQLTNNKVPVLDILHSCDNPRCVNPNHLREGTHTENMQEMLQRNRRHHHCGSANKAAKLTEVQVQAIKLALHNNTSSESQLSKQFNVSNSTIHWISIGKTWKHVVI